MIKVLGLYFRVDWYKKVIIKHSRGVRINFLIPLLFHIVKHSRVKIIIDIVKRSGLKNLSLNAVPQKTRYLSMPCTLHCKVLYNPNVKNVKLLGYIKTSDIFISLLYKIGFMAQR